ncbi:MAG: hypothetical protein HOP28_09815 [Gemmatimonadales bacterium]|nr:hypothetical protein [Gemmatimonadales bacterium]
MTKYASLLIILASAACADRIAAPRLGMTAPVAESVTMQKENDRLAFTYAPVNSFDNLPSPAVLDVLLDGRTFRYRAVVVNVRLQDSRYERAGCRAPEHTALVLWRDALGHPGLDVLTAAAPFGTSGPLGDRAWDQECGMVRRLYGAAYLSLRGFPMQRTERSANSGHFSVRQVEQSSPCDFLARPSELSWYGASCERTSYDIVLEGTLVPDRLRKGAMVGANRFKVSARQVPGARFTINCRIIQWTRSYCG